MTPEQRRRFFQLVREDAKRKACPHDTWIGEPDRPVRCAACGTEDISQARIIVTEESG